MKSCIGLMVGFFLCVVCSKKQKLGSYDGETGRFTVDFSAPLYQDVLLLSKIFMEVIGDHSSFDGQADPGASQTSFS